MDLAHIFDKRLAQSKKGSFDCLVHDEKTNVTVILWSGSKEPSDDPECTICNGDVYAHIFAENYGFQERGFSYQCTCDNSVLGFVTNSSDKTEENVETLPSYGKNGRRHVQPFVHVLKPIKSGMGAVRVNFTEKLLNVEHYGSFMINIHSE
jgi:hypothetical protein